LIHFYKRTSCQVAIATENEFLKATSRFPIELCEISKSKISKREIEDSRR